MLRIIRVASSARGEQERHDARAPDREAVRREIRGCRRDDDGEQHASATPDQRPAGNQRSGAESTRSGDPVDPRQAQRWKEQAEHGNQPRTYGPTGCGGDALRERRSGAPGQYPFENLRVLDRPPEPHHEDDAGDSEQRDARLRPSRDRGLSSSEHRMTYATAVGEPSGQLSFAKEQNRVQDPYGATGA